MGVKLRLQRHGKKGKPFFHIVAADSRAKRDGKFIEKLGTYNPNTNPATIELNLDATMKWIQVGAEMTDTARAIMSYKGVLYKNHLANGVKKGAFSEEEAEKRFNAWLEEKNAKVEGKRASLSKAAADAKAKALADEVKANEARKAELEAKNAPVEEEVVAEEAPVAEETAEEATPAVEETPVAEEEAAQEEENNEASAE